MITTRTIAALAALALCTASVSYSQIDRNSFLSGNTSTLTTTSNYYFAKPNELTIVVNVLGFVQRPGRYEISSTIDLINLIALAGGPAADGTLSDVKITRLINLAGGQFERKEFTVDVEELPKLSPAELILQPGDIIELRRTGWSYVRDAFSIVLPVATITYAIVSTVLLLRR